MTNETQHVRTESGDCAQQGGCTESRMENIYRYLDGALEPSDVAEVRTHIEDCIECQSEHDLEIIIRDVVKRSCDEKAPITLKEKIMLRITQVRAAES